MQQRFKIAACLAAALAMSACSTKPRNFSAEVRPIGTGGAQASNEAADFATCDVLVRKGHKSGFLAAAATGAAGGVGVATGVATGFAVGGSFSAMGATAAAAVPIFGIAAAFGVNRMIRSGKERKYKRVMTDCMSEFGYEVTDWTKAPKKRPGTAIRREAPVNTAATPELDPAAPSTEAAIGG